MSRTIHSELLLEQRIELWDATFVSLRRFFVEQGIREVSTPVRVLANAIEPYIEPIFAGSAQLQTSPELAMKLLLRRDSIYQIAHCFRAGERGPQHNDEFHLVEWYRIGQPLRMVQRDVEAIVARAAQACAGVLCADPIEPSRWEVRGWLDIFRETTGATLRGDESAQELKPHLARFAEQIGVLRERANSIPDSEVAALEAWTELFSLWSDASLDPWLARRDLSCGVHVVDFPAPLAALARVEGRGAKRFESYWRGAELANGYDELRDAAEQSDRFAKVNAMRERNGQAPLPLHAAFLEHLRNGRMPAACGAALGLERLLRLAADRSEIWDIHLFDGRP